MKDRVYSGRKRLHALEGLARIHQNASGFVVDEIAQHAQRRAQILVQQRRRRSRARLFLDVGPQFAQVFDVGRQVPLSLAVSAMVRTM